MAKRGRDPKEEEGIQALRELLSDPNPFNEEQFKKKLLSSSAIRSLMEKNVEEGGDSDVDDDEEDEDEDEDEEDEEEDEDDEDDEDNEDKDDEEVETEESQAKDGRSAAESVPVRLSTRCANDTSGPVLELLINEISTAKPKHAEWLRLFVTNCEGYGWNDCSCEYSEKPGSRYIQRHGAASLYSNVRHFIEYFMPRKMCPSKGDYSKAAAALRALITSCIDKGLLVKNAEAKSVLKCISKAVSFDGQKITRRLNDLHDERWWARLSTKVLAPCFRPPPSLMIESGNSLLFAPPFLSFPHLK
jgi:hypothetical protein